MKTTRYFLNCFLLLIPIFVWNLILVDYLPEQYTPAVFDKDIPTLVSTLENVLRAFVFVVPAFMFLSFKTRNQKIGLGLYLLGIALYFTSWILVIAFPQSDWSKSIIGFTAPAFSTLIWFIGIGLIGNKSFFRIPYISQIYMCLALIFVVIHTTHAYLVFQNY